VSLPFSMYLSSPSQGYYLDQRQTVIGGGNVYAQSAAVTTNAAWAGSYATKQFGYVVAPGNVILATGVECIEVHLSNVYKREPFRHHSTIADVAVGRIMGFGADGYMIALRAARNLIEASRSADASPKKG